MNNNENNNLNMQPNIGSEIMMGNTTPNNNQTNNNINMQSNIGSQVSMNEVANGNNTNEINTNIQSDNTTGQNLMSETNYDNNIFSDTTVETSQQQTTTSQNSNDDLGPISQPQVNNNTQNEDIEPIQPIPSQTSIPTQAPKQKKSKIPMIIIILLIIIILGLSGYIVYDKFFDKKTTGPTGPTPTEEIQEKTVLLKDKNQEVVYSDIDEVHDGKIKRVPYINIDSKYAEEINNEITSMLKKGLEGQIADTAYGIDYQYYVNDEFISIKFTWETESGTATYSKLYNINQYTGEKVTDDEILSHVVVNKDDLNNTMVESYKTARPLESVENNTDSFVKECYQKDLDSLSSGNIKGMYLSDGNELCILFDLHYIAGVGEAEAILNTNSNRLIMNPFSME